ncbi:MAG: His-Xaa-Ser system radical SAM maturase HxsB [Candidatus Micrarchaeia archaeon]
MNENKSKYIVMPFNFKLFDNEHVLLVNDAGDYYFLKTFDFDNLINYKLDKRSAIYQDLNSRQLVSDYNDIDLSIELLSTKYRSIKSFLRNFTSLHMMVITLRCNHKCRYCQVTSEVEEAYKYDMSPETARRVVDYIFYSPSQNIKIEFQGGEPLLNWSTIVSTVDYAEVLNKKYKKNLEFVICTNLTLLDEEKINFINNHNIAISTSLDGNKFLHDKNRILRNGKSSYDLFIEKLELARKMLTRNRISALMTTTIDNIDKLNIVIDEYIKLGFDGIFLRALNPYGLASKYVNDIGYPIEKFISAFEEALNYIIEINIKGKRFIEYYTALLLKRILTPFGTGFVDLQSPSGAGIAGVIYDFNGDVYPADEARMLARMGDKHFLMGNVFKDKYIDIFNGEVISDIVKKSCLDTMPGCATCVYKTYCGADPIRNYLETKDIVGHRPSSNFCKKHMGLFDIIFNKLKNNKEEEMNVFWSWISY